MPGPRNLEELSTRDMISTVLPDLTAHLASFGIRNLPRGAYIAWRTELLGPEREAELGRLRQPLREGCATAADLARYWDFISEEDVSAAVFSGVADAICAAGEFAARQLLARDAPPPARILDIGCSIGHLTTFYAAAAPEADVTGIDLSPKSVERARIEAGKRGLTNVRFRDGDWLAAFRGDRFDLVVATHALAFTLEDVRCAAQLSALVAEGGRFVCVESFDSPEQAEAFAARCARHGLVLRAEEMLAFADAGVAGSCPGMVFAKAAA